MHNPDPPELYQVKDSCDLASLIVGHSKIAEEAVSQAQIVLSGDRLNSIQAIENWLKVEFRRFRRH